MPDVLKFVLNKDGVKELLQSQEMQDIIKQHASAKASQAGDGYAYSVKVGQNRAYANVYPDTKEAAKDNLVNNTLEKVIRS
jgi:hydroxymethylglutaryl-CoA reductase